MLHNCNSNYRDKLELPRPWLLARNDGKQPARKRQKGQVLDVTLLQDTFFASFCLLLGSSCLPSSCPCQMRLWSSFSCQDQCVAKLECGHGRTRVIFPQESLRWLFSPRSVLFLFWTWHIRNLFNSGEKERNIQRQFITVTMATKCTWHRLFFHVNMNITSEHYQSLTPRHYCSAAFCVSCHVSMRSWFFKNHEQRLVWQKHAG